MITKRSPAPFLAVMSLVLLSGCSTKNVVYTNSSKPTAAYNEVPISSNFPTSAQLRLQAAQHWANIANDTGKTVASLLSKGGMCIPSTKSCNPVFINPPIVVTEFSRVFHNQLITTMVTEGLHVSKQPEGAVLVDIDLQPVVFTDNRPQYRYAGVADELGPGVWALREVSSMSPSVAGGAPPKQDTLHWFRSEFSEGRTPQTEIVITVSASDRTRYLARATNVYYITDGDKRLYDHEICSTFALCSKQSSGTSTAAVAETKGTAAKPDCPLCVPKPLREFKVEGDCPLNKANCLSDRAPVEETIKSTAKNKK